MNRMDRLGRLDDFISLLDVIGKGTLDNNVAVHLCLDIGTFHRVKILSQMTYPKISMDWWLTVKIILKGKALQLFRGYMGAGLGRPAGEIEFKDCVFNFVVPSDDTLTHNLEPYKLGLYKPGIIQAGIDALKENVNYGTSLTEKFLSCIR